MKKALSLLAVMVLILGMFSGSAMACNKTGSCYSNSVTYSCTGARPEYGSHKVTYPNGYTATCKITVTSGNHSKLCAGCGAKLGEVFKTCSEMHSDGHCFDRTGLCK
ncbi:MAG: hypothetical protein K5679_10045 [Lachnospiraceae bacterium]|nr:hypothetical protein [Lachnospiraceae bacterium]